MNPEASRPLLERLLASLQDLAHLPPDFPVLQAAGLISDLREATLPVRSCFSHDYLVRIGIDD